MNIQPTSSVSSTAFESASEQSLANHNNSSRGRSTSRVSPHTVQSRQQLNQMVVHLNNALPEFGNNLSASIVNHGGHSMIEIRNGDTVIRRFSDSELLEFIESRKIANHHLVDQYI